jgi:hypothetical protein
MRIKRRIMQQLEEARNSKFKKYRNNPSKCVKKENPVKFYLRRNINGKANRGMALYGKSN